MNTDTILWLGLNNALFSLGLALLAAFCAKKWHAPKIVHFLWLLVLLKLLTPPMFHLPMVQVPVQATTPAKSLSPEMNSYVPVSGGLESTESGVNSKANKATFSTATIADWFNSKVAYFRPLGMIWLVGSVSLVGWSLFRIFRFGRLLNKGSHTAPAHVLKIAEALAQRLGLNRIPVIRITPARISPMVWWAGGRVQIMIPAPLITELNEAALQSVLAHEMAHVKRRDYLVRWLEWLCCVLFWWNPMVWWAQRNLRATEEICCDALVLSASISRPSSYAQALLSVMEILAKPVIRPPAMASEINSDGFLERRFKMIVQQKFTQKRATWTQLSVLLAALLILPMGFIVAADFKAVEQRLGEGVAAGELSLKEALAMMQSLQELSHDDHHRDHDDELILQGFDEGEDIPHHDDKDHGGHRHHDDADDIHHDYSDLVERYRAEAEDLRLELHDKEAKYEETVNHLRQLEQEYSEARERLSAFQDRGDHLNEEVSQLKAMVEESAKSRKAAEHKLNQIMIESELTKNQAAERQAQLQAERARQQDLRMMRLQRQYEGTALKLRDMVEEGALSEEEAKQKLKRLRNEFSEKKHQDKSGTRLRRMDKDSGGVFDYQMYDGDDPKEGAVKSGRRYYYYRSGNGPDEEGNGYQAMSGTRLRRIDEDSGDAFDYQMHDGNYPKEGTVKSMRRYYYNRSESGPDEEGNEYQDMSETRLRVYDDERGEVFDYQIHDGDLPKEEAVKSLRRYFYHRSEKSPDEAEVEHHESEADVRFDFDAIIGEEGGAEEEDDLEIQAEVDFDLEPQN